MESYGVGGLEVEGIVFTIKEAHGSISISYSPPSEPHNILVSNCERALELILKQNFVNVHVTPHEDGFIGTGEDLNGIPTYAILKPNYLEFGRASQLIVVISTSKNEEFSKHLIMSARMA
jgi:hypothetical protein